MPQPPRIAVVGSINMDLVAYTDKAPRAGETVAGTDFRTAHGGKGANQAVAAARLGAAVCLIGCVGSDVFGSEMQAGLAGEGIDTAGVRPVPGPSGIAAITVEAGGQNRIVVVAGANGHLQELGPGDAERIARAQYLLLQLETPLQAAEAAAAAAKAAGVQVILTPAPAQPLPAALLAAVDWILPNETELHVLTGHSTETLAEIGAAAARLARQVPNVLVTIGERGSLYVNRFGDSHHEPANPVTVVDTTGAGDTFTGALAVALAEGKTVPAAMAFASRAAAVAVSRHGAQPAMPRRRELPGD